MSDMPEFAPYEGDVIEPAVTSTPAVQNSNPFLANAPAHVSAGAVAIESQRAVAEVQGRMVLAKQFPRDSARAYARSMQACQRIGLAEKAVYSFNKGGKVEGPSIRLAEELARHWGNIEFGLNELSRRNGESEMEAFAWDLETNTKSSQRFTVRHIRDRNSANGGAKALTDERDVYEITANMGSRRTRARLLAILPPELVADAVAACRETVKNGGGLPFEDRVRRLLAEFMKMGVTADMIADHLEGPVDRMTPDQFADLRGVYASIRDSASKVSDHFGPKKVAAPKDADAFEAASAGKPVQQKPAAEAPPAPVWIATGIPMLKGCKTKRATDEFLALYADQIGKLNDADRSRWNGEVREHLKKLPAGDPADAQAGE